jgi:hypothetical protein
MGKGVDKSYVLYMIHDMSWIKAEILPPFGPRIGSDAACLRERALTQRINSAKRAFQKMKWGTVVLSKSLNLSLVNSNIYLLRGSNRIDILDTFCTRDSMRPCRNRADADRIDGAVGGRKRTRVVTIGVPKQGDAAQAVANTLPNRVARAADMNQARAALYQ